MKKELDSKMNALIVGVDEKVRNLATKIEQIDSGYRHQKVRKSKLLLKLVSFK